MSAEIVTMTLLSGLSFSVYAFWSCVFRCMHIQSYYTFLGHGFLCHKKTCLNPGEILGLRIGFV